MPAPLPGPDLAPDAGAGPSAAPRDADRHAERRLTDPRQIASILQRVRESRTLLTARVPRVEGSFLTTLLDVDPRRQRLRIDELNPSAGHEALLRVGLVSLSTRLAGVEVAFRSSIERVDAGRGAAFYTLPFPSVLLYHQRRDTHRVEVPPPLTVRAWLVGPDEERLPAEVRDLSPEGLCLQVAAGRLPRLEAGQRLQGCDLLLPDGLRVGCDLEVRWVRGGEGRRPWRIGARFVALSGAHGRAIAQLVAQLEREHLRLAPARPARAW
jgi:c-di-GMP-binding flagellar brake protein YcgR